MSCKCQCCGQNYKVDVLVPDALWEQIKPAGKPEGAGMLCGVCIFTKIESLNVHQTWHLSTEK